MKDINILKNNGVDVDEGVRLLGDMEMYDDTLNDFMDEIGDRANKIKKYFDDKDMSNYAIEVHALKSDSKYLGFTELANMALEHQLKSEENDVDYVNNNYDSLVKELDRIISVVNEYLNS